MIAADKPFARAMVKKAEVSISLLGRPKEILDTPREVLTFTSSVNLRMHVSAVNAEAVSEEMDKAKGSTTMSYVSMP